MSNDLFASTGCDSFFKLWDNKGNILDIVEGNGTSILKMNEKTLIIGGKDRSIQIYRVDLGKSEIF